MDNQQSAFIMRGMIEFIETQGSERVLQIETQMKEDFTMQSIKMVEAEKLRLEKQFDKDLKIAERDIKIAKSRKMNEQRVTRMRRTNQLVESL